MHPVTVQERARAGKIPGAAKPGKPWEWATDEQVADIAEIDAYRLESRCDANANFAIGRPFATSLRSVLQEAARRLKARSAIALTKEQVFAAIDAEPELPGQMPDEMWEAIRNDRDAVEQAMRIGVRQTKSGIKERLNATESGGA